VKLRELEYFREILPPSSFFSFPVAGLFPRLVGAILERLLTRARARGLTGARFAVH